MTGREQRVRERAAARADLQDRTACTPTGAARDHLGDSRIEQKVLTEPLARSDAGGRQPVALGDGLLVGGVEGRSTHP
jgi:hypothetical protein